MLCVYYRLPLPKLPETLCDFAEDRLANCTESPFCDYLNFVTNGGYVSWYPIVKTSNIAKLIEVVNESRLTSIEGPKGSGKTILCATLYQMLATDENFNCIFLTSKSFDLQEPSCKDYFNMFLKKHSDIFGEMTLDTLGKGKSVMSSDATIIKTLIHRVLVVKAFHVFIDVSMLTRKAEDNYMQRMRSLIDIMSLLLSHNNSWLLISISSGARYVIHVNKADIDMTNSWENTIKKCQTFTTIGFTYEEAQRYFANKKIQFGDIYPLTGTNPLLLSVNLQAKSLGNAKSNVEKEVQKYMLDNLHISDEHSPTNLSEYFIKQELARTINFAYCASRCGEITDEELEEYESTFLAKHHLTVVEKKSVTNITQDDQDDANLTTADDTNTLDNIIIKGLNIPREFCSISKLYSNMLETVLSTAQHKN